MALCDTLRLCWLRTSKYIVLTRSNRNHRPKNSHKMLIICIIQSSALLKNCETWNVISWSNNSPLVWNLIEFQNNYYLRDCNNQLSHLVFYLNRNIPAGFVTLWMIKFLEYILKFKLLLMCHRLHSRVCS